MDAATHPTDTIVPEQETGDVSQTAKSRQVSRLRGWGLLTVFLILTWPHLASPWLWPYYRAIHERASATLVRDARGDFLGVIPGSMDPLGDFGPRDHKALVLREVPPLWWNTLVALEDQHWNDWRSYYGVDPLALSRSMVATLGGRLQGGSTLSMMLVRQMRRTAPSSGESSWSRLKRKLIELRDAPVLRARLPDAEFQRWVGTHVPLVGGAPGSGLGGDIYGLELAARILFGRTPSRLTPAQQAVLAAAFKRPVLLAPPGRPRSLRLARARWQDLKQRARRGLGLVLPAGSGVLTQALDELDRMPLPRPKGPVRLLGLLPGDPAERFRVLAHPARRAHYFARAALVEAIDELRSRHGTHWRGLVSEIRLTIDSGRNLRFRQRVEEELLRIEHDLRGRLELALHDKNGSKHLADVLIAVTNARGRLILFYNNREAAIFNDGTAGRCGTTSGHARYLRPIGSVGKLFSTIPLVQSGTTPDLRVCNAAFRGLRNADGSLGFRHCDAPGSRLSLRRVLARSVNLAMIQALRTHTTEQQLHHLAEQLGLHNLKEARPLYAGLPLGVVTAAPVTLLHAVANIGLDLRGARPMPQAPGILDSAPEEPARRHCAGLGSSLQGENGIIAETLLSAPLEPRLRGTLRALADWRADTHPQVDLHIAKTGTTEWRSGVIRDKYVVGALRLRGRHYAYLVLVGSSRGDAPLGRRLPTGRLVVPLVRIALESLP